MSKAKKYLLALLMWCAVIGYIVCASMLSHNRLDDTVIERVDIKIVDSTASRHLVTEPMVRGWLAKGEVKTVGETVGSIDFAAIESLIAKNGFVDDVSAYAAVNGTLYIEVSQRRPFVRIMTDGYNLYATKRGYVFSKPASSAMYVPVITGSYTPPFPSGFEGSVYLHAMQDIGRRQVYIDSLERSKADTLRFRNRKNKSLQKLVKKRLHRRIYLLESKELFEMRVRRREDDIAAYKDTLRMVDEYVASVDALSDAERAAIKKERGNAEDFLKLINFVEMIEDDNFWHSEIVQIIVDVRADGVFDIQLIPRSGSFRIEFGTTENAKKKFERLSTFYADGLERVGWNAYASINVAYDGLVICRKR